MSAQAAAKEVDELVERSRPPENQGFTEEDLRGLIGREFPGGTFTIAPHRQWLLNDVVQGEPGPFPEAGSIAHPLFVYLSTGAMGITWDEVFAWCGSSAEDGPMFGEHETDLIKPLRVGATYSVTGRVVSGERKEGRRTGIFDIVAYTLEIFDENDKKVAATTNSIVFPRRSK